MAEHTQGEWSCPGLDGGDYVICAPDKTGKNRTLAHVYNKADADLIADAPATLRALEEARAEIRRLRDAAIPFFVGYEHEPIGDSDLDDEQPIRVYATLGRWRQLRRVLRLIYPTTKGATPQPYPEPAASA